jgi:hypothetical protein
MAALATTLTEFSDNGDSRTYTISGHTASKPKLVLEKRKVPVGNQTMSEFTCSVVYGTEDADGAVLPQKISLSASARYPVNGDSTELATDLAAAFVILQDIVQSDEFEASITSQNWVE